MQIGKPKNVSFGSFVEAIINIDGIGKVLIDKGEALSINNFVLRVSPFLSEGNILERSEWFSDFLQIVSLFVLLASVFSLVGKGVVLPSFFDLIFRPSFVSIDQKYLFNIAYFNL